VSEKVQLIERLLSLAERLIYTPQAQQETPKEKEIKTAVSAIKDLADVAVRLQAHEAQLGALVEKCAQRGMWEALYSALAEAPGELGASLILPAVLPQLAAFGPEAKYREALERFRQLPPVYRIPAAERMACRLDPGRYQERPLEWAELEDLLSASPGALELLMARLGRLREAAARPARAGWPAVEDFWGYAAFWRGIGAALRLAARRNGPLTHVDLCAMALGGCAGRMPQTPEWLPPLPGVCVEPVLRPMPLEYPFVAGVLSRARTRRNREKAAELIRRAWEAAGRLEPDIIRRRGFGLVLYCCALLFGWHPPAPARQPELLGAPA